MPHVCSKVLTHSPVSMLKMRTVLSSLPDARCLLSVLQSRQFTARLPSQHVSYIVTDTDRPRATGEGSPRATPYRALGLGCSVTRHNGTTFSLPPTLDLASARRDPDHYVCLPVLAGMHSRTEHDTSAMPAYNMATTCDRQTSGPLLRSPRPTDGRCCLKRQGDHSRKRRTCCRSRMQLH